MRVGAIVLDYHKRSEISEIADPSIRLSGGYELSETQSNISRLEHC